MEYRIRLNLATTAFILTAGFTIRLLTSTLVAARAYRSRGDQAVWAVQSMTVKGSTRKRIQSNLALWEIEVQGENPELVHAFGTIETGIARVRAFLEERGFNPAEIGLGAIDTTTHYVLDDKGRQTRQIASYVLSRTFFISTSDVHRVNRTAGEVTELLRDGVMVSSSAPDYHYTELAALKVQLLGEASADARSRADEIARNSGCRIAQVRSARMGVMQITRPHSTDVSDYGIHDTTTIEKDVQAVVTVDFQIEPTS
jgi:hypothetical protein